MLMTGPARIGRDAELNETPGGAPVAEFPVAYDYGRRDNNGERPTQWVVATLWGSRARSLAPHLKKGSLIEISMKDLHVEVYETASGTRHKLKGRVVDVEFIPIGSGRNNRPERGAERGTAPQGGNGQQRQVENSNSGGPSAESTPDGTVLEDVDPFDQ